MRVMPSSAPDHYDPRTGRPATGANLVAMGAQPPARRRTTSSAAPRPDEPRNDLIGWIRRSGLPRGAFIGGGLALCGAGLILASVGVGGFFAGAAISGMITLGGGLTFLGALKGRRREPVEQALPAAPPTATDDEPGPQTSPAVLAERGRRIVALLGERGPLTFESIVAHMRWTQGAVLETLVALKASGTIEEDLELDSGQWIYKPVVVSAVGTPGSLMLEDRVARRST